MTGSRFELACSSAVHALSFWSGVEGQTGKTSPPMRGLLPGGFHKENRSLCLLGPTGIHACTTFAHIRLKMPALLGVFRLI